MDNRVLKVASIQFKPTRGELISNLDNLFELCHQGIDLGARLLVLPEMCLTGYIWESAGIIAPYAENARGESFQRVATFCKENSCFLAYGFAEKDEGLFYNSQNLVSPEGKLLSTYRKIHLYDADTLWATSGNLGYISLDCSLGKIGLGICMDLNFDQFVQFHIDQKTRYLLLAVNWLDEGFRVLDYWQERLKNFQGTVIIANTYGQERGIPFSGLSGVLYKNQFQQHAPKSGDFVVLFEIPIDQVSN